MLKKATFSAQILPLPIFNKIWMKMKIHRVIMIYSTENRERLQYCIEFYMCRQNATVINNTEQDTVSNIVHFVDEQISILHLWTLAKNFGFSIFEFKFYIAKAQCHSYLIFNKIVYFELMVG